MLRTLTLSVLLLSQCKREKDDAAPSELRYTQTELEATREKLREAEQRLRQCQKDQSERFETAMRVPEAPRTSVPLSARDHLEQIFKGALIYVTQDTFARDGGTARRFPAPIAQTPPVIPAHGPIKTLPAEWSAWAPLEFAPSQVSCAYTFDSRGEGEGQAEFTAQALCDIDGDGVVARYEVHARYVAPFKVEPDFQVIAVEHDGE